MAQHPGRSPDAARLRVEIRIEGGKAVDGRRLRALAALEGMGARNLIEQALAQGSSPLRQAALLAIGEQQLDGLQHHVVAALREGKTMAIQQAAVRALGAFSSDEALALLLDVACDDPYLSEEAARGVAASQHPQVVQRTVARLRREKRRLADGWRMRSLLQSLEGRRGPQIAGIALDLMEQLGATAARVLLANGDRKQLLGLARRLRGRNGSHFATAVEAVFRTDKSPFRNLSPLFTARDRTSNLGQWRVREVLENLAKHRERLTPEWESLLLSVLERDPKLVAALALWFAAGRDARAVPALVRAASGSDDDTCYVAIEALGKLRAPAALDAILDWLWDPDLRWTVVLNAARRIPGARERLKARLASVKRPQAATHTAARELLTILEKA